MYDLAFVFEECGFGTVPGYIERERLFNVSFDTASGDIKLYVLDESERFLYKLSTDGITRQYAGDDRQFGGDPGVLTRHLQCNLNEREIVIDAVEDDVYYLYLDDAGPGQSMRLMRAICRTYGTTKSQILESLNLISGRTFDSLEDGLVNKAVSLVKIPFTDSGVKIYSRPFLRGSGFDLNTRTRIFLSRLYGCEEYDLSGFLKHLWVAKEIMTEGISVVTQHHTLLHRE